MWSDYIVSKYNKEQKCENISDLIPLYEYDLHKRYAAFCFANNVFVPIKIRFLNRRLNWLVLTLRLLSLQELDQSMTFQEEIISELALQNKKHLFEPLKRAEMKSALENECCFGLFKKENHLSAQINLLLNPGDEENLALDLQDKEKFDNSAIIDYVAVSRDVRGYLLQKTLIFTAECVARNNNKAGILAVTSPKNIHSLKNFLSQGFSIVATQRKYTGMRHYLWKKNLKNPPLVIVALR